MFEIEVYKQSHARKYKTWELDGIFHARPKTRTRRLHQRNYNYETVGMRKWNYCKKCHNGGATDTRREIDKRLGVQKWHNGMGIGAITNVLDSDN